MKKPKKPKSSGIRKQEDIIKDYNKVIAFYLQNPKLSFRSLEKMAGVPRDNVSWYVNRYQILKALNKLDDKSYLVIFEELPIVLFKGLTTLRVEKEKDVQKFCITFAKHLKNFNTNNWKRLNLMCKYYWSGQIQNYSDFERIMNAIKIKRQKSEKNLLNIAAVSISELIDIQEKLRAENEKLRMCLRLHGINDFDLIQKKIDFEN